MTPEENLERLSKEIFSQAEADTSQILTVAKEKAKQIRERAAQDAAAEKESILSLAKRDAERIRSQAIATTQMKARTMLLESREKMLSDVFSAARANLASIQQWSDYDEIVKALIVESASQLGAGKVRLRADKVTSSLITDKMLKEVSAETGCQITLGEPLEKGMGVVASTEDGHLTFDNLLETRLAHLESELRSPVYHLLMGESL